MSFPVIVVGLLSACCFYILSWAYVRPRPRRLPKPPGPQSSWFRPPSLPRSLPWRTYAEWRDLYGDIIYIHIFGNPILVLNSAEVIDDLLEKRGTIYSSRPRRVMLQELIGWDWPLSAMPYGTRWRKERALFERHFHSRAMPQFHPIQIRETHALLRNLLLNPNELPNFVQRQSAALIMMLSYGHSIKDDDDVYVTLSNKAMSGAVQSGGFGTYMVDYIPILKYVPSWVPGAKFQTKAKQWREATRKMIDQPFEMVKRQMASGMAVPSFMATELERWNHSEQDPEQLTMIKDVAALSYAAGSETTVAAIMSFFLAMIIYPDILHAAQDELDSVVGRDRLPQFSDRGQLPYINCLLWECLRWNPVVPLSLPHSTLQDDIYEGYLIPRGTTVLPNIWAVCRDKGRYPDPFRFYPERFADQKKNDASGINPTPMEVFGFGRRICPGRWLAVDTIWITIASVLSVYNIAKAVDETGAVIEPEVEYTTGLASRPKPFHCDITPRSESSLRLIQQTGDET